MEQNNIPRESCEFGTPQECYHRQKQVQKLEQEVERLDQKIDTKVDTLANKLECRISTLEQKSDKQDHIIEKKLDDLDKQFSVLFEKNNATMENLTSVLGEVKSSYKIVGDKISDISTRVQMVQSDVSRLDGKVSSVESQVHDGLNHVSDQVHDVEKEVHLVDNKGKMDVVEIMRDQAKTKIAPYLWAGGGAGIVAIIWAIVQHFMGIA